MRNKKNCLHLIGDLGTGELHRYCPKCGTPISFKEMRRFILKYNRENPESNIWRFKKWGFKNTKEMIIAEIGELPKNNN